MMFWLQPFARIKFLTEECNGQKLHIQTYHQYYQNLLEISCQWRGNDGLNYKRYTTIPFNF